MPGPQLLRGRAGALALVPSADPVGLAPLIEGGAAEQARHAAGNNRSAAAKPAQRWSAPCGGGCLDKLPSSVRRAPALSLPVVGERLRLPPPAAGAPPPAAAAPAARSSCSA